MDFTTTLKSLGQALNPFNKSVQTAGPAGFGAAKGSILENVYPIQIRRLKQDVLAWRQALDRAENVYYPVRTQLLNIYADVVLDLHLTSVLTTRKINVLGKPFKLVNAAGVEDPKLTKLLTKPWFRTTLEHAMDSKFWGHSLIEFMPPVNGEFQGVTLINRQYVFPEAHLVRSMPGMMIGVDYVNDPAYAPWILEVGDRRDFGLLLKAAPAVIWKKNVLGAWADFTELFGMPYRAVSGALDGPQMDQLNTMMANMGQAGYGIFPEGVKLDFIAPTAGNEKVFNAFIERINSELSKLILGQTMTTDSGSSRSQGEVHERVADAYTKDDATWLSEWVNTKVLPFLSTHGYAVDGYEFQFDDTETLSKTEQFAIVSGIMKDSGYNVAKKYLEDTFGVVLEDKPAPPAPVVLPPPPPGVPSAPAPKPDAPAPDAKQPTAKLDLAGVTAVQTPLDKLAESLMLRIYANDLKDGAIEPLLYNFFHHRLNDALHVGYTATDPALRVYLNQNIQRFSGFKTYAVQAAMQEKLTDADGNVRPFADFKADALQVHKLYNVDYLETEYNTAVASAQMASKWAGFEDGVMLSYRTVGDGLVRAEHAAYDGVTAPKDDPFWDTFYPPCDFNCRCDVVEVAGDATATNQAVIDDLPDPAKNFGQNVGKTGQVFDASHPYFQVSEPIAKKIEAQL